MRQEQAISFYRKFGFYEIAPCKPSRPDAIFMEKQLVAIDDQKATFDEWRNNKGL